MFGGIFPSQWSQPQPRRLTLCRSLTDHNFPVQPQKLPTPIPAPAPAKNFMPLEERCLGEKPFDTTEIDELLEEIYNPSPDIKKRQILQMINTINENLQKNIAKLENNPTGDGDNVSKDDLLKLLQVFLNYSRNLENYLKETKPSFS